MVYCSKPQTQRNWKKQSNFVKHQTAKKWPDPSQNLIHQTNRYRRTSMRGHCDFMVPGEGMLVGCQTAGFFLVEAEVNENPYVQSRPFRVNAGPVSHVHLNSMQSTRYLSEFKAGDEVLIVNREGKVRKQTWAEPKLNSAP